MIHKLTIEYLISPNVAQEEDLELYYLDLVAGITGKLQDFKEQAIELGYTVQEMHITEGVINDTNRISPPEGSIFLGGTGDKD